MLWWAHPCAFLFRKGGGCLFSFFSSLFPCLISANPCPLSRIRIALLLVIVGRTSFYTPGRLVHDR